MADASPIQTSFNAGELSRRLDGRPDLAAYASGVAEMTNFVPLVQGPAMKRSGTRFVALAKDQANASWLIPFEAQLTQAYIIEASNLAFRFFTNNARCEIAGVPVEVVTPYITANLPALDWQQSNDVLYMVDGVNQQQKLSRTGALSFTIAPLTLSAGPFKDLNSDQTITMICSVETGAGTLTASSALFAAGHVGSLVYLEIADFRDIKAWEPGISTLVGNFVRSQSKIYKAITVPATDKRTGTIPPVHTVGQEWDGMYVGVDINTKVAGGVLWEYVCGRFGTARITGFTSSTVVNATVVLRMPVSVTTTASWRWALAAFSGVEGWPGNVILWNERLIYTLINGLYSSVVGDFSNFSARNDAGELTADQALRFKLPGADAIQWMVGDRALLVGTTRAEYSLGPVNVQAAFSAVNVQATRQSFYGSARVRPLASGNHTLFVQRAKRKLRELGYDFQSDRYVAPDLTTRAPHITAGNIIQIALQQEPEALAWALRGDGALICLTYSAEQDVRGWSRHVIGGVSDALGNPARVESIAVIPSPDGGHDDLWLLVQRWVNGAAVRTIERLETFWEEGTAVADGYFVDGGATYSGAPVSSIGGLTWLIGQTVKALVDGATVPDMVVSGSGTITLPSGVTGSTIHVGLGYTARLKTLRIEAGGESGTAQGKLKRIVDITLRLLETMGLRVGPPQGPMDQVNLRKPSDAMDTALPVFTGDRALGYAGGWDRDGQVVLESSYPLPCTILALMPSVQAAAK